MPMAKLDESDLCLVVMRSKTEVLTCLRVKLTVMRDAIVWESKRVREGGREERRALGGRRPSSLFTVGASDCESTAGSS
jgi:hypothetical protein